MKIREKFKEFDERLTTVKASKIPIYTLAVIVISLVLIQIYFLVKEPSLSKLGIIFLNLYVGLVYPSMTIMGIKPRFLRGVKMLLFHSIVTIGLIAIAVVSDYKLIAMQYSIMYIVGFFFPTFVDYRINKIERNFKRYRKIYEDNKGE